LLKKIGIVGGLGWRATLDYYAALHELATQRSSGSLEVAVESLDFSVAASLLGDGERDGRWDGFDNYHRAALARLERSEAEVAIIACNSPHARLSNIARGLKIKVVDLFEAACAEAARCGARRLLVLGTPITMRSKRLHRLLAAHGVEAMVPTRPVARKLQQLIDDLQRGPVADALERLLLIVKETFGLPRADDFVGLHCTELPLALPESRYVSVLQWEGMQVLNASVAHIHAAFREAANVDTSRKAA
jgi:aspartate racemase